MLICADEFCGIDCANLHLCSLRPHAEMRDQFATSAGRRQPMCAVCLEKALASLLLPQAITPPRFFSCSSASLESPLNSLPAAPASVPALATGGGVTPSPLSRSPASKQSGTPACGHRNDAMPCPPAPKQTEPAEDEPLGLYPVVVVNATGVDGWKKGKAVARRWQSNQRAKSPGTSPPALARGEPRRPLLSKGARRVIPIRRDSESEPDSDREESRGTLPPVTVVTLPQVPSLAGLPVAGTMDGTVEQAWGSRDMFLSPRMATTHPCRLCKMNQVQFSVEECGCLFCGRCIVKLHGKPCPSHTGCVVLKIPIPLPQFSCLLSPA